MKSNFSTIAVYARQALRDMGFEVKLGHVQQLLAAGLGYGSLAAFHASSEEKRGLQEADYVLLDVGRIASRAASLGYSDIAQAVIESIADSIRYDPEAPKVFAGKCVFLDEIITPFINEVIYSKQSVINAAADTNAYFSDSDIEPQVLDVAVQEYSDVWEIPVEGYVNMTQDPDRSYFGDTLLVSGVVKVTKVGRVCLLNDLNLEVNAKIDYSFLQSDDELGG